MILLLTREDDHALPSVVARLEALGADHLVFDPARYPAQAAIRIDYQPTGRRHRQLRYRGRWVDLDTVTAVWDRRPGAPEAAPEVAAPEHRALVAEVSQTLLAGVWDALGCPWLPGPPRAQAAAADKPNQLALAARLGFTIPRTVVTNVPEDFLDLYAECGGRLVTKVLRQVPVRRDGEPCVTLTHTVRRRDAAGYRAIRHGPVILQAYVPKDVELRITVVGSRVFAAAIHSQAVRATRDDWRRGDFWPVPLVPHDVPADVAGRCVRLVRALGLRFGAIDMVLTPDGEHVFLEINPNGEWAWIEDETGLPIGAAIADLLVRAGTRAGRRAR
jgi:hypothetical protein